MTFEYLTKEHLLVELRKKATPKHPRHEEILSAPAGECEPLVKQIGGEHLPYTGITDLMGHTQHLEICEYKNHHARPKSKYMILTNALVPQLKRLFGYKNTVEALAMADALHARWERTRNCEGSWFVLSLQPSAKASTQPTRRTSARRREIRWIAPFRQGEGSGARWAPNVVVNRSGIRRDCIQHPPSPGRLP